MLKDLFNKNKSESQITVKVLLRKHKESEGMEFAPVYISSTTKTMNNSNYMLNKSFQEIFYIESIVCRGVKSLPHLLTKPPHYWLPANF